MMYDEKIKRRILFEIFEDPSVQTRIRQKVTARMPNHIRDMKEGYSTKIQYMREYQRHLQRGDKITETLCLRVLMKLTKREKISGTIGDHEKKLQELHQVDQLTERFCNQFWKISIDLGLRGYGTSSALDVSFHN